MVTRSERVLYLRAHPELWNLSRKEIVDALKDAGMLSRKTSWPDVNLHNLMLEASGQRRVAQRFSGLKDVRERVR